MTIKIIEDFETVGDWTVTGAASNIQADLVNFLSGSQGIKFDKLNTNDRAGIYKTNSNNIDFNRFVSLIPNIFTPIADQLKIKFFDLILDDSSVPSRTFWDWDTGGNYECDVEPPAWAPAWALWGTDFATAAGGILRIANVIGDICFYVLDTAALRTLGEWGQAPNDYNWGVVKARCKVDTGAVGYTPMLRLAYNGAVLYFHIKDGQLRIDDPGGYVYVSLDTTSDFVTYELYVSRVDDYCYLLANGIVVYEGRPKISGTDYSIQFGNNTMENFGQNWEFLRWGEIHKDAAFALWRVPTNEFVQNGWNDLDGGVREPHIIIGSPDLSNIERFGFQVFTDHYTDLLSSPTLDAFSGELGKIFFNEPIVLADWTLDSEVICVAKRDYFSSDGTKNWDGRVLSFGTLTKALNAQVGNYTISDLTIGIENASGYIGGKYGDEELKLYNRNIEIAFGDPNTVLGDFRILFRGVINNITFDDYQCNLHITDPVPKSFNRVPNQFVTSDSFPNVPDSFKGYVAPMIIGTVSDATGALPVVPVDFSVTIGGGVNDRIDFGYDVDVNNDPVMYAATLTGGLYSTPSALATEATTRMQALVGAVVDCVYNSDTRKFMFQRYLTATPPARKSFGLYWSGGTNASRTAARAFGFDQSEDKTSSDKYIANREALNVFVVARHPCKDDLEAKVWIEKEYIGDKTTAGITFNFNYTCSQSLKWTTLTLDYQITGKDDISVNISGMTDDDLPSGNLVTNPVDALKIVLTRIVGFSSALINVPAFDKASALATRRIYTVAGAQVDDQEWDTFIEEYCKNFRMDFFVNNAGLITVDFFQHEISDLTLETFDDVVDFLGGSFSFDAKFSEIINRVRYEFKLNYTDDEYKLSDTEVDQISINDAGQTYDWVEGTLQLTWIRDATTARRVSQGILALFAGPAPIVKTALPMTGWELDLTDKRNITNAAGPVKQYDSGLSSDVRGFRTRLHRVLGIDYNIDEYSAEISWMDMFRMSTGCWFLGSRDWAAAEKNWLTASQYNKDTYGYLADRATGEFSNGDPGKRLCSS